MFKFILIFILLTCWYSCLQAQQQAPGYLGIKTTYHPLQAKQTVPPKGYQVVFINYVGRHGARFMTKPGSDVIVANILQQADANHALTQTGKNVKKNLAQFVTAEKGNYENITLLGAEEQRGIAQRMFSENKTVFNGKAIDVLMTSKVRTQQSAKAFLTGFPASLINKTRCTVIADSLDAMLRFYDMSPAYDKYINSKAILSHLDSLQQDERTDEAANHICQKLFFDSFCRQLSGKKITADIGSGKEKTIDATAFAQALYDVYSIWFLATREIKQACHCTLENNIGNAFSIEDLQWLDLVNNAEDFYAKGPAEDAMGIQVTIAAPLLVHFINTTDSVINGSKQANAVLRFTHAEAISPFATLLGIPEASAESQSAYAFQKNWQASHIIPLSANIQWILYKNEKHYSVKFLLNEKEVKLPVETSSFPYYDWQTVREYYIEKLSKLGINLHSDMKAYLSGAAAPANK